METLETELSDQKYNWQQELSTMETKLKQACSELEKRLNQVHEMTQTIRYHLAVMFSGARPFCRCVCLSKFR